MAGSIIDGVKEKCRSFAKQLRGRIKNRAFRGAATEMAITVVTATLPIWFFPFIALFLVSPSYSANLLDHSISNGELFLFCTSLVGPLIFILFRVYETFEENEPRHFKYRISFVFPHALKFASVIIFICLTSAAIFGMQKINPKFQGDDISKMGYMILSISLFAISIVSATIAMTIRNEMDNYSPSRIMRKEEDDFAEQYKKGLP